jgi:hypothetical protein
VPVFNPRTTMAPPSFPHLLFVPALAIDAFFLLTSLAKMPLTPVKFFPRRSGLLIGKGALVLLGIAGSFHVQAHVGNPNVGFEGRAGAFPIRVVIRQPDFAHLHPLMDAGPSFESVLPSLPQGDYRVFAELTHEAGVTQILTNELRILYPLPHSVLSDPEDSWIIAARGGDNVSELSNVLAIGKDGNMSFPFVFPTPGDYWLWVQVKVKGTVQTGRFRVSKSSSTRS